uniref:protein-serine/threonine phosphatase n=1 Tax=Setaria digitata TaxID=48799 RepID=A0A915PUD6_9BILA
MGAYLSKPITEKVSECGSNERIRYAATSMQGWRINQEDAHNCIVDFDEDSSFFAVYDGHGGSEVAQYSAHHLPDMLKANNSWFSGNYAKAIQDTFLELDELLRSESVMRELKKMAGTVEPKHEDLSDEDEDKQALYEEAGMPIETILERYGIVLHRDQNGKESVIDLDELRAQLEQKDGDEKIQRIEEIEKKVEENGSNVLEQEASENSQNGNAAMDREIKADESFLKKQSEEKVMEEKSKKRVSESSVGILKAKRTRSSNDIDDVSEGHCKDSVSNSSMMDKSEGVVQGGRYETTGESEVASSEPEVAGPPELSTTTTSTAAGDGDDPIPANENPQPSAISDGQVAFSSDSESVDEDYNADEEMSEGEEEEELDDDEEIDDTEQTYSCPSGDTPGEDSGSTACVVIIFKDKVVVGNAGDSRAVLCRKGMAVELSVDHKPEDDIERRRIETAGGEISVDGRVNGGLNLSRALGDHFYKKNAALPLKEQMISALPDVKQYKILQGDEFIVIACDGIWNSLTSQEVVDFIRRRINDGVNLKDICEQICDHCLSPNTAGDGTGCDNMTIIVAQILCSTPSLQQPSMPLSS